MTVAAGTLLGRYLLVRRLGAGGMAEVWSARDEALGRTVAVKILLPGIGSDPDVRARFVREARISAGLDHPHVVQVFDVGEQDGRAYLVSQLMDGGRLTDQLCGPDPVPWATGVRWLSELAAALDYAHSRSVIHRDVKPANVLFDTGMRSHLADFGIAKSLEEASTLTRDGQVIGTPAYMAPEQAMGREIDGRSDQYALGMVGYRLATGKLPWERLSLPVVIHKTIFEAPPPPSSFRPELPAGIDVVFERVLAKDPGERFACCTDFVAALAEIVTPAPLTPRVGTTPLPASLTPVPAPWAPMPAALPPTPPPLLPPIPGTALHGADFHTALEGEEELPESRRREGRPGRGLAVSAFVAFTVAVAVGIYVWLAGHRSGQPVGGTRAAPASAAEEPGLPALELPPVSAPAKTALLKVNVSPWAEIRGRVVESLPETERVTPLNLKVTAESGASLELHHPEHGTLIIALDPLLQGGTWLIEGDWSRKDEIRLKEEK